MFDGWQTFYQMTGEAAATLIGLLFIVASLTTGREGGNFERGVKLFTTPTVFHLTSVLVVSALALVPEGEGPARAALMLVWLALSLMDTVRLGIQIHAIEVHSEPSDLWWYGVAPPVIYLAMTGAAALALAHMAHAAAFIALSLIVLLLVAIRNAWDLVTWLAPRRK